MFDYINKYVEILDNEIITIEMIGAMFSSSTTKTYKSVVRSSDTF